MLMASTVYADGPGPLAVWGGGKKGDSTYTDAYVPQIISTLESQALAGYSWGGVSEGTVFNVEQVSKNPTNLAVGQLDLIRSLKGQISSDGKPYQFTVLAENLGPECLYLVTNLKGYKTFGDFLGNSFQITVATGGPKSGSFATLENLAQLYPDIQNMIVQNVGSAPDIIAAVKAGKATHGFFIMRPDPQSATFKAIADAGMTIIPVIDFGIEGLYDFLELKVANGGLFSDAKFVTTACTSVALITGDPTSDAAQALQPRDKKRLEVTIQKIGSLPAETLRPTISSWSDMWDSLRAATGESLKTAMEASKAALEQAKASIGGAISK